MYILLQNTIQSFAFIDLNPLKKNLHAGKIFQQQQENASYSSLAKRRSNFVLSLKPTDHGWMRGECKCTSNIKPPQTNPSSLRQIKTHIVGEKLKDKSGHTPIDANEKIHAG